MAATRKDVAEVIAQAITDFEQRCVGRNPKLVQAKTVGSLLVARSSTCLAPIERKRLRETPGSLRFARVKRRNCWRPSARSSVHQRKGTDGRLTPQHFFVHSDYSVEGGWWADIFIFAFDRAPEDT